MWYEASEPEAATRIADHLCECYTMFESSSFKPRNASYATWAEYFFTTPRFGVRVSCIVLGFVHCPYWISVCRSSAVAWSSTTILKVGTPLDIPTDQRTIIALATSSINGTDTTLGPNLCNMTHIIILLRALTSEADWYSHFRHCVF